MNDKLSDLGETQDWDDVNYDDYDEAQDIITPPMGVYDLSIPYIGLNNDTKRISIMFRIHQAVELRDPDQEGEVTEGQRCMLMIFPPKVNAQKDDQNIGRVKAMSRRLLGQELGTDIKNIRDWMTQMEQIFRPDSGNYIRVTIGHRPDKQHAGVVYADYKNDWQSVDSQGNVL